MQHWRNWDPAILERFLFLLLAAYVILIIFLERKFPYRPGMRIFRKGFWIDFIWYTLIQSYILKIVIFEWFISPLKKAIGLSNSGVISQWPLIWIVLFFLLTHDLYIYWFHRLQHTNKWLWKTHEAHHSGKDVDWLAGSRSHPMEIIINQTIEFLPIFILLDTTTASLIVPLKGFLDAIWGLWIHSNVSISLGKLIYICNGPEMHQWHHGNHREVFFKNYATKFSFFDWLFGTAFLPGRKPFQWPLTRPLASGLPYRFPDTYLGQLLYPICELDISRINSKNILKIKQKCKLCNSLYPIIFKLDQYWKKWFSDNRNSDHNTLNQQTIHCPNCSSRLNYFFNVQQLYWHCKNCNTSVPK